MQVEVLPALARAVTAQADGMRGVAAAGEEGKEMLGPAPGRHVGAVDEQQRRRTRRLRREFAQDLELHSRLQAWSAAFSAACPRRRRGCAGISARPAPTR